MRVVTGSTGLSGNNLVRTLLQAGYEVWGAGLPQSGSTGRVISTTPFIQGTPWGIHTVSDATLYCGKPQTHN